MGRESRENKKNKSGMIARLVVESDGITFLGRNRIDLLSAIRDSGSITKAANVVGLSYKAAWDSIDSMNNMAAKPLVERVVGGKNGGGTRLTVYGNKLINTLEKMESEYERRLSVLMSTVDGFPEMQETLSRFSVATTARNQFPGAIVSILKGAVNSEVEISIGIKSPIIAIIPNNAVTDLSLQKGTSVHVVFSSSSVMLSAERSLKISARNQIHGVVNRIEKGAVNSEISVKTENGKTICANINNSSLEQLKLKTGTKVSALIKASSVILAARVQ